MKIATMLAAGAVALASAAVPAAAKTTVHRVHGPVRLLPHHNRKVCETKWVAHHRVRKCNYH